MFDFSIGPDIYFLSQLDFVQSSTLVCGSKVMSLTSANYSGGKLKVLLDFVDDLEGENCQLNITYDKTLTLLEDIFIEFKVTTTKAKLVFVKEEYI